jgi:phosphoribosylformylglycinamidine synthase
MRNASLKYICKPITLRVETTESAYTGGYRKGQEVVYPIAHHDGNYTIDAEGLRRLEGEDRVAFRYAEPVNGSVADIAGILSGNRRVLGMMPHPERAVELAQGGADGSALFRALAGIMARA